MRRGDWGQKGNKMGRPKNMEEVLDTYQLPRVATLGHDRDDPTAQKPSGPE